MALLEVRALVKRFGGLVAVDDIDLDVEAGEIRGIIAPNGAGKPTLFNTSTGTRTPFAATFRVDGETLTGRKPARSARAGGRPARPG